MSFLAPLFFLAAAAVAAPIIFHLIRREPKGRVVFSSLMFIKPSPPRVTRRSKVDNWLLLLIRGLAILLVAAAFTRPFLRTVAETTTRRAGSFTVLLVDQSASMQREDLWRQGVDAAWQQVEQLDESDRFAVATFASSVNWIRDMKEKREQDPRSTFEVLESQFPGWERGHLGAAILEGIELMDEATRDADQKEVERNIVVISDMQQSSRLDALRGSTWPKATNIRLIHLTPKSASNASVTVSSKEFADESSDLRTTNEAAGDVRATEKEDRFYRVKLSNSENSLVGRFQVNWLPQNEQASLPMTRETESISVPPGTERIIQLKAPADPVAAIQVSGDEHPYDNQYYVIVPEPLEQRLLMIGQERDDPRESLYYYLEKLPLSTPGRSIEARWIAPDQFAAAVADDELKADLIPMVIVQQFPIAEQVPRLKDYVLQGGRVLVVLDQNAADREETQTAVRDLADDVSLSIRKAEVKDYALLSRIDFNSDVFSPLADPRYSDFTKVQFWKHAVLSYHQQSVEGEESGTGFGDWDILARFDTGSPALMKKRVGEGRLYVLAAGWQPTESQLALSTKFVPILSGLVGSERRAEDWESHFIGESFRMPPSPTAELVLPDGSVVPFQDPSDAEALHRPGIYKWRDAGETRSFAVNIPVEESDFKVLDRAALERLGVKFEDLKKEAVLEANERQKRDAELEQQQSLWKWLLLSALGLIGVETLLSVRKRTAA